MSISSSNKTIGLLNPNAHANIKETPDTNQKINSDIVNISKEINKIKQIINKHEGIPMNITYQQPIANIQTVDTIIGNLKTKYGIIGKNAYFDNYDMFYLIFYPVLTFISLVLFIIMIIFLCIVIKEDKAFCTKEPEKLCNFNICDEIKAIEANEYIIVKHFLS